MNSGGPGYRSAPAGRGPHCHGEGGDLGGGGGGGVRRPKIGHVEYADRQQFLDNSFLK